ncbi:MAG: proton-conducting transporter membrane subunit [Chitinivibrionales bacterium]|nr:proton-conducting transporter membrane subunit [Chitinivibrionales bacterium]
MTPSGLSIYLLFLPPLLGMLICTLRLSARAALGAAVATGVLECLAAAQCLAALHGNARLFAAGGQLFVDALSGYHLALVALVFCVTSIYARGYFAADIATGKFRAAQAQRYGLLYHGFLAMLVLVLTANNMGLLWIALEATTLVSALLILTDGKPASLEAMWKYLIICSVGIALAFVGTLLLSVAARGADPGGARAFFWTTLIDHAAQLNPGIMLAAFVFALIGFGTKAGLAPMHTWLPDAHSQAPTPVSAVFSGVMLNCALYGIMRYLPLTEDSLGSSMRAHHLLLVFGLVSIVVAAIFIPAQHDIKRLLAYSSVEHIGIIAVGLGLGGVGTIAALFHTLNHSLAKTLAFFSAGRLAETYGTHDMRLIKGASRASPLWGGGFLVSILALVGMAPFSIFMSELLIVKTALQAKALITLVIFCGGALIVFVSALKHAMDVSLGSSGREITPLRPSASDAIMVVGFTALLAVTGLWLPHWYLSLLDTMKNIIEHAPLPAGGLL